MIVAFLIIIPVERTTEILLRRELYSQIKN